jgi:hypothetical protein
LSKQYIEQLLPQYNAQGIAIDEKAQKTSQNCAAEAPKGDSIQDLSALCNAADPECSTQSLSWVNATR